MEDLFGNAPIHDAFHFLVQKLSINEAESKADQRSFESLRTWLSSVIPDLWKIELMGSITRGTRLSRHIQPNADIDCLLVIPTEVLGSKYEYDWNRWAEAVSTALRKSQSGKADVAITMQAPFISLRYDDRDFDITLATAESGSDSNSYLMPVRRPIARHSEGERYENAILAPATEETQGRYAYAIVGTDPFSFNRVLQEFQGLYAHHWRHLIVFWKYWNVVITPYVRSYVIEHNVFFGLQDSTIFADETQPITLLHFIATFFRHRELYDSELFEKEPSFLEFREAIFRADAADQSGERLAGVYAVASLFKPVIVKLAESMEGH